MDCCETTNKCGCNSGCCDSTEQKQTKNGNKVIIDFLYLDLSVCTRCQGTGDNLEDAIDEVVKVLKLTGIEVILNKIHINSIEKAIQYKFISSPTIRVNGEDIQIEAKESSCESCGDLCGDEVDCRVWIFEGEEYTVPPTAMIIESILKVVYGKEKVTINNDKEYKLPENLKKFFKAMGK